MDPKETKEIFEERLQFQELVAKISTKFIDLPADKIDQAINDQFEEIAEYFNADRVAISRLSEKGEVLAASHMWFSDRINAEKLATHMKGATYPNVTKHIMHKEYWSFSDPDDFSHWHPERPHIFT